MSKETFDTLGNQKKVNYALREEMTKEEFVKEVTTGLGAPPQYFPENVRMNKSVNTSFDSVLSKGTQALSVSEFEELANQEDVLVLDTRAGKAFKLVGTIPGAWYIGIDGGFAPWVGALIKDIDQKLILLADEDRVEEVVTRLSRVGYDGALGYLKGGLEAWKESGRKVDSIESVSAQELIVLLKEDKAFNPIDVRKPSEYTAEHILKINSLPLDELNARIGELDINQTYTLHCQSGYRSLIAASILKANGFKSIIDVTGGFKALIDAGAEHSNFVCPSTL